MSLFVETEIKKARVVHLGDRLEIQVWSRFGWTVDSAFEVFISENKRRSVVSTQAIARLMVLIEHGYSIAEYRIG